MIHWVLKIGKFWNLRRHELKLKHWSDILRHKRSVNFIYGINIALSEKIIAYTEEPSVTTDVISLIVRNSCVDDISGFVEVVTLIRFVSVFEIIVPFCLDIIYANEIFERMEI